MTNFDTDYSSEADLEAEFDRLFPQGFAGPDVVQELAPAGWESSPLLAVFHPSLAQSYVFSDGHQVTATDGRVLDLGSFRGSGGFLAEILNRQTGAEHYDYPGPGHRGKTPFRNVNLART